MLVYICCIPSSLQLCYCCSYFYFIPSIVLLLFWFVMISTAFSLSVIDAMIIFLLFLSLLLADGVAELNP